MSSMDDLIESMDRKVLFHNKESDTGLIEVVDGSNESIYYSHEELGPNIQMKGVSFAKMFCKIQCDSMGCLIIP